MSTRASQTKSASIYQLKITLKGIRPPIWRRVLVPGSFTLEQLHEVIQRSMNGWGGYHLHEFEIARVRYGPDSGFDDDWGEPTKNEANVTLAKVAREKTKFTYMYDFGDDWTHEILVEKILPPEPDTLYPVCLKGKRACPPEDCGGPWGYAELLQTMSDPKHPEYLENLEWLGRELAPEDFDLDEVNDRLATLRA